MLTDGVITINNGDIQNINSFNVTGKVEATELTDNVLTITNGRITNAFEITCNNYVSVPLAIVTALQFNDSSSMSISGGRLLNVTSIDVNQGDGEVKATRLTDGDVTIENGHITDCKSIDSDLITVQGLRIQNGTIFNCSSLNIDSGLGRLTANLITDGTLQIRFGRIENYIEMESINIRATNFTDGFITINNADILNVKNINASLGVGKIQGLLLTDGVVNIQNGNIDNIVNLHASQLTCDVFTDNVLTIQNGEISNVTNMYCNGNVIANQFTDNILTIQNGDIFNAIRIDCVQFTKQHAYY